MILTEMEALGRQPLFKLLAGIIVILLADRNPWWGLGAAAVWIAWIYLSYAMTTPKIRGLQ